ncbi:MAG: c-type cytochrome [Alphaproteobacteria bacterium]
MKKGPLTAIIIGVVAAITVGSHAQEAAQSDSPPLYPLVQQGADLAEMWCNACHVTGTGVSEHALDSAPPFQTLAAAVADNPEFYRGFLINPHYPMKGIALSRNEIESLLAYIQSLEE